MAHVDVLEAWHLLRELELAAATGDVKAAVFALWFHDWLVLRALVDEGG
jgi:hypothetical protein